MKKQNPSYKRWFSAKPRLGAECTRHYRLSRFTILVLGVFLSGCSSLLGEEADPMSSAAAEFTFEQYEIVTGVAKRQTVLTGFLLGGATAELVVVNINAEEDRRLHIYAFDDGSWSLRLEATLRREVLFIDVAGIGGTDRLVTYEPGRLNWFDPESATERELVAVTSNFNPPRKGEIPHVDITQDVNGDDRDDLVVPDVDGFGVFIQMSDGAFADPVKIGPPTDMSRIYGADGYRYDPWSQSRVHQVDYNQNGRSDLVYWNEDHFEVHVQNERGLFASEAETFTTDVAFDSDDLSSLATGNMTGRVLHSLTDLNGDGVSDLVVNSLEGRSISGKHSTYEVHFGARAPDGGTGFARGVDIAFQSNDRIQLGMDRLDFDGDGQVDLVFTTISVEFLTSSLWKRWKAFWGDSIWLNSEFYRMEGDRYPDEPNAIRRVALVDGPSSPGWVPLPLVLRGGTHESRNTQRRTVLVGGFAAIMEDWWRLSEISSTNYPPAFNQTLLIGDVTGDGRSDLLKLGHPYIMKVFVGVPGPNLFTRRPHEVSVAVPIDGEYTWLVDLNGDGKQDLLMHHQFTLRDAIGAPIRPPGTDPHRVTILIAQ